jgi:mannan endo-1,4-beta-mannosidase
MMIAIRISSILVYSFFIFHYSLGQFSSFVSTKRDKLMDGDRELRFISFNIPNLHYIEDDHTFESPNPWRIADEFEIRDALTAIKQLGGNVVRIYVPSVRKEMDSPLIIRHVESPGQFNEEAFKGYDKVLQIANELRVRVIIPFVDNWWWWGGTADYARFLGKPKEAFWTDSTIIADFKKTIEHLINRVNIYTGISYKDDKAILGWETGNELEVQDFSWTKEIAGYIKSLDRNHLVIEGTHRQTIQDEALSDPNIDVLSLHFYRPAYQTVNLMLDARMKSKDKKPFFVGEIGRNPIDSLRMILDSVISSGMSGIMIWSMRSHNRDGGFYYHQNAYRWPGFISGKPWDEQAVINLFREKAYQINGVPSPAVSIPQPPKLLPIATPYKISWQGSTGASSYSIERKERFLLFFARWQVIDSNASDANINYRPLFIDTLAEPGTNYSYRVRARNSSGISEVSEVIGPVSAPCRLLVDEFEDSRKMARKSSGVTIITNKENIRAKEDGSRLLGSSGDSIVYQLPAQISSVQVDAFFTTKDHEKDLKFSSGVSQQSIFPINASRKIFEVFNNAYRAFTPVRYNVTHIPKDHRYIVIFLKEGIQLGRLEIGYDPE